MDPDGNNPLPDPIQFLPNGTLPPDLYWNPDLVYRLEIRAGNSQADQLIYLIENYVPVGQNSPTPVTVANSVQNQITNPQFFDINFVSPLVISAAGTYNLAPGWNLILSGTGSATITQKITTVNSATATNPVPAYALEFNLSGSWSSAILQQTLSNIGNIWNNQFLNMSVLAFANDGTSRTLTLQYQPPSPQTAIPIAIGVTNPTIFATIQGSVFLPAPFTSTASNFGSVVQLQIVLPPIGDTIISNVQALPQATPLEVAFEQETLERQEDHLFHYFENSILMQPKDNLLCGWNFPINPSQFNILSGAVIATQCDYLIDQTILYQQGAGSRVTANNTDPSNNFDLVIGSNNASNQFALIQYISGFTIQPYWSESVTQNLSSLVKLAHTGTSPVNFKMRLIWRTAATLPPVISATEPIASWSSGGDPVFQTGWTAIKPLNDPTYTTSTLFQFFDFNQFPLPNAVASPNNPGTLGIVLYTVSNMQNPGGSIVFDRISLVPNDFAIDCNTRTFDEELEKCEFYYENSYDGPINPSSPPATSTGETRVQMFGTQSTTTGAYPLDFNIRYRNIKNRAPSTSPLGIQLNSISGATASTHVVLFAGVTVTQADIAFPAGANGASWNVQGVGVKSAIFGANIGGTGLITHAATTDPTGCIMNFHYTVDARLGKT